MAAESSDKLIRRMVKDGEVGASNKRRTPVARSPPGCIAEKSAEPVKAKIMDNRLGGRNSDEDYSRSAMASFSEISSCSVAVIIFLAKSLIFRPLTSFHSPFSQVIGKAYMIPSLMP